MANIKETAVDILNRCIDSTFENGLIATENLLDKKIRRTFMDEQIYY